MRYKIKKMRGFPRKDIEMKKIVRNFLSVLIAVVLFGSAILTASATSTTIELETRSALLIDRSGSMDDQAAVEEVLSQYDFNSFDEVVYFDTGLSTSDSFAGGGNSSICEAIDKVAAGGFTHITVVTDGEQWPADYSNLGIYTDLDLTVRLVDESEEAEELVSQLESHLSNSNLKVVKPEGEEVIILNEYKDPIYTIEIPDYSADEGSSNIYNDGDEITIIEEGKRGYFPWWLIILLAALIAAIFDFIHELITRRREGEEDKKAEPTRAGSTTVVSSPPVPMPAKAIAHIAQGAHVVADLSGSMAAQQEETAKACMDAQKGSEDVLCFGDSVSEHAASELSGIQASGKTHGWEAMEQAAAKGWDEIVLVSDLKFNGKEFDKTSFAKNFKKITVVAPKGYSTVTLENLEQIADEVEVLHL